MSQAFVTHLQDLFADLGSVKARAMFGGYGFYLEGRMIGVIMDETLYLKADEETRARFADAGGAPFVYTAKGKTLTMSYWSLPDEAMESPQAMRPWAELASEAAMRKAKIPAKRGSGKRKAGKKSVLSAKRT